MRADSWYLYDLPENLVSDWRSNLIYSEFDVQTCAYYWIRRYLEKERGKKWHIRAQPVIRLSGDVLIKPDIGIYSGATLYDAIELKCHFEESKIGFNALAKDFKKFSRLKDEYNLRHAYAVYMYDLDENLCLPTYYKEGWMKSYLTFVGVNVRLDPNGRLRNGYYKFKANWDRHWR